MKLEIICSLVQFWLTTVKYKHLITNKDEMKKTIQQNFSKMLLKEHLHDLETHEIHPYP